MQNLLKITFCAIFSFLMICQANAMTVQEFEDKPTHSKRDIPMLEETVEHWELATEYKAERRYELARQHLLLALATCNSTELRDTLQRELQIVDLQIRTMR